MPDDELKRLLEGLFSDVPSETGPDAATPESALLAPDGRQQERLVARFQAAARLSRAATSTLSLDTLLPQVVELIRQEFDYYYAGIFLVDEANRWAVLQSGTGKAGRQMMEQGHRLGIGGDSMIGWCVANGQARIALDVGEEAVHFANPLLPATRSEMALPLISRDRTIGAMTIQSAEPAAFSQEDITILQTMADQLANAIENARLFAEATQRTTELSALLEATTAISSRLDLEATLTAIAEQMIRALGVDGCTLSRWDREADSVVTWIDARLDRRKSDRPGTTYALADYPLTRKVLEEHQPHAISVSDPEGDPAEIELLRENGFLSLLMLPLVTGTQTLGLIELEVGKSERQFTAQELELATALAGQAALALENARLYEQTQGQLQSLTMLSRVSQALTSAPLRVEEIGELVVRQFMEMTNTVEASLSMLEPETELMHVVAYFHIEGRGDLPATPDVYHLADYPATARAMESLKPLVVQASDPEADPAELAYLHEYQRTTLVIIPLAVKGQAIGVIELESWGRERHYTAEELDLAMTLANQAAVSIENARLFEETRRQAEELAILNELAQALTARLSVEEVLQEAYRQVSRLVDTTNFYVGFYDKARQEISFPLNVTQSEIDREILSIPVSQGLTGYVIRNRTKLLLKDNVSKRQEALGIAPVGEEAKSWLGVPLMVGDRVLGAMVVQSHTTPGLYGEHDLELMVASGSAVAVALHNALLFEERQAYAQEQEILRRISQTVGQSLELHELVKAALEQILDALQFDAGLITLYDEDRKALYLAAEQGLPDPMALTLQQRGLAGTLCEYVFQRGDTVAISDVRQGAPVDVRGPIAHGLYAYVGAPLVHRDRRLGTFCLFHRSERPMDDRSLSMLEAIGLQLGMGVQNALLYRQTQAALAEVEATHRTYLRRSWQEHLRQRGLLQRSGFLYDEAQTEQPASVVPVPDLWRPEMEQALAGEGASVAEDKEDPDGIGLAVPITLRGQTLGVIGVEAPDRQWTEDDATLIAAVSEQLAQTLESARLFADTQRRVERERLIGEITAKLRASTDIRQIVEIAAVELGQTLDTSRTLVRLSTVDPDGNHSEATVLSAKEGEEVRHAS